MSGDFDTEDVAAMRRQGDLRAFLREQLAAGRARRSQVPTPTPPRPTGRRPGAWPPGTRPPGPAPTTGTPAQWQQAVDDYRATVRRRMARDDTAEETT